MISSLYYRSVISIHNLLILSQWCSSSIIMTTYIFSSMDEETSIETFEIVRCILGDTHDGMRWIFNRAVVKHPSSIFSFGIDNPTKVLVNVSLAVFGISFMYKTCKEITEGLYCPKVSHLQPRIDQEKHIKELLLSPETDFDDLSIDDHDSDSSDEFDKIGSNCM